VIEFSLRFLPLLQPGLAHDPAVHAVAAMGQGNLSHHCTLSGG